MSGTAATVTLSGPSSASATVDAGGTYVFSGLAAGVYVVAASESGYAFSPSTASVTISGSDISGVDFTGTAAPSVSLSWAASSSSGVSGYDVYRSTTSGGPYTLLNSALVTGASYVDKTVNPGETYYYVTTAVGANDVQSGYSNQATATVPQSSSAPAAAITWTLVQHPHNYSCSATGTSTLTCSVNVSPTTAGNLLILMSSVYNQGSSTPVFSSASGDSAWTHCPSSAAAVNYSGPNWEAADCAYILNASGGATTLTFSWSGSFTSASMDLELFEVHRSTGIADYDTGHSAATASCSSCSAPTLTLTGTSDFIAEFGAFDWVPTAISGAYSTPTDFDPTNVEGAWAGALNVSSYTVPTWTQSQSGGFAGGVVAFR